MPLYFFRDANTGNEFQKFMKISEQEEYLKNNPHISSFPGHAGTGIEPGTAAGLHSGRGINGGLHIDDGMNDMLKRIKRSNIGSSIETK